MLALKLTSARVDSQDMDDSITLMRHLNIKSEEQLFDLVEKYTEKNQQTPRSYYFTKEAYNKYKIQRENDNPNMNMKS